MSALTHLPAATGYPVPPDADDPRFRWVFGYWQSKVVQGRLPGRGAFDPIDFPHLLGLVNLIEVIREAERMRFRYRLWGSLVSEMTGRDYTGCYVEDLELPVATSRIQETLEAVVRDREAHFWRLPAPPSNKSYRSYRRLLLPLAQDGEQVDMLFAILIGDRIDGTEALGDGRVTLGSR